MKIAQVAPLAESVPPRCYGGTERVVSFLTEELVAMGHDVTLFASGDSVTGARLVPTCSKALRMHGDGSYHGAREMLMLERVFAHAHEFDVVHFHTDFLHFPLARRHPVPAVTTLHGRLDLPALPDLYTEFADMPLVSISNAQRRPLPMAHWRATVYHGLPPALLRLRERPGRYLAFLGRISPEKRVDRAIEIAEKVGMDLKVAAKIDAADRAYYEQIAPLLKSPRVQFIGEIGEEAKEEFLGNACAVLFPIDWPEPFGLVMIEAMACGTPVIAFRNGSVPEVMEDGVTGFVVDSIDEAVHATRRALGLSRRRCREVFDQRFTVRRMAHDYLQVYHSLRDDPCPLTKQPRPQRAPKKSYA